MACTDDEIQNFFNLQGKIQINGTNKNGDTPLLCALKAKNVEVVKLILRYAKENNIVLDLNQANPSQRDHHYPLLEAIYWDDDDD
eukprot:jgi/Orpsp1_1/1192176/evm.model.d7180000091133.1